MALKPHVAPEKYQVGFFLNSVSERGGVLVAATGAIQGSGQALDSFNQQVEYAVNPSGRYAIGINMDDFVNKDLTETPLNRFKAERQIGDKVSILQKGEVVTNFVTGANSVQVGAPAYLGATGYITPTQANGAPLVGKFLSRTDPDGYAKVMIDL